MNPSSQAVPKQPTSLKPVQPRIIQDIPVRAQVAAAQPAAAMPTKKLVRPGEIESADRELDQILRDVTHEVKNSKTPASGIHPIVKKARVKRHGLRISVGRISTVLPVLAAVAAAALLAAAAVYAFRQTRPSAASSTSSSGKVATSSSASDAIQAAGGTLVSPSDLDNFSQSAQSQINALNDAQDFNSKDLTDQNLGL